MPERETAAMGEELWWRDKAMWLLVRALGGKVSITDEEWARVPERPELILDHADGVMRWTALEPEEAQPFTPDTGHPTAADRAMVARATGGGIRSQEVQPQFSSDEDEAASPLAAELDGPEVPGQLALDGTEPGHG